MRRFFRPSKSTVASGLVPEVTTAEVLAAIAEEMNPGGLLYRSTAERATEGDGSDQKQVIWQILDGLAKRKGFETAQDLCLFLKAEAFVVWLLSHARRHVKKLEDAFSRGAVAARERAERQFREDLREQEEEAVREAMSATACEQALSAARWLRAAQRGVGKAPVEAAVGVVRRLLLELPEVWDRWDRVRAARRALVNDDCKESEQVSEDQPGPFADGVDCKESAGDNLPNAETRNEAAEVTGGGAKEEAEGREEDGAFEKEEEQEEQDTQGDGVNSSGYLEAAGGSSAPEEVEVCDGTTLLTRPIAAWEYLVSLRLARAASAGGDAPAVIRVAGRIAALKVGDRVMLSDHILDIDVKGEIARLKVMGDEAPTMKTKLKPRIKALKAIVKAASADGTKATDSPLQPGEVGTLVAVDGSAVPYQVQTASGATWWYERKAIVAESEGRSLPQAVVGTRAAPKAACGIEGGRLAGRLAPLVVCVLRRLPPESAEQLLSFDDERAAAAVTEFLRSKQVRVSLDALRSLVEAEQLFNESFHARCDIPSLLGFMLDRGDLKALLDTSPGGPAEYGSARQIACGDLPDRTRVLDTVRGVVQETFEAGSLELQNGGSVGGENAMECLALAEERVCDIYSFASFQDLAGGTSFLRFCAKWVKEIGSLLALGHVQPGPGKFRPKMRLRLRQVARLAMAAEVTPSSVANEAAVGIDQAKLHLRGVLERHFCERLESLGYDSIQELWDDLVCTTQQESATTPPVLAVQGLLWRGPRDADMKATDGGSKEGRASEAMEELRAAPFMVDLAEWMDWDNRFFDTLGPLAEFIFDVVVAGSDIGPSSVLLEGSGRFIKLPSRISRNDFSAALQDLDAAAAAAIAVGLAAENGRIEALSASFELLRTQVKDRLSSAAAAQAARFVLSAVACTPAPLRPALAVPLFIEPFLSVVAGAERALSTECRTLAERAALRQVGLTTGRLSWIRIVRPLDDKIVGDGSVVAAAQVPALSNNTKEAKSVGVAVISEAQIPTLGSELEQQGAIAAVPPTGDIDHSQTNDAPECSYDGAVVGDATSVRREAEYEAHGFHPDTLNICKDVRIKFGLEKGMAPPTPATLEVVNKSIERLAADLYAKEVHFLLEVRVLTSSVLALVAAWTNSM